MRGFVGHWSQDELNRTIDEVKRRSLMDPGFRVLAVSHPHTAIAKINPKPLPLGVTIKFIGDPYDRVADSGTDTDLTIILPPPVERADELSDEELEQATGGMTQIQFPVE